MVTMNMEKLLGIVWVLVSFAGGVAVLVHAVELWNKQSSKGGLSLLIAGAFLLLAWLFGIGLYKGSAWARALGFFVLSLLSLWGLLYLAWLETSWQWHQYVLHFGIGLLVVASWWCLIFCRR